MVVATPADVVAAWRPLTDDEETVAGTRLATTERWIRQRLLLVDRDLNAEVAADADFRQEVIDVQVEAVMRVMLNPDRVRSESIDDYSVTKDRSIADGQLRITAEEWARLGINTTPTTRKAFSIDTTPDSALRYPRILGYDV